MRKDDLVLLANAARSGLEVAAPNELGFEFDRFPHGNCGSVTELFGRILLERTGQQGLYVCGTGHPALPPQQSHAWLEVGEFIVDLTHDQFKETGLRGWVHGQSPWHSGFECGRQGLCLEPSQWMVYPLKAYAAMKRACDAVALPAF